MTDRAFHLKDLYSRLGLEWPSEAELEAARRWAVAFVAPDERRGAPALTIETLDGDLAEVLTFARQGLGELLAARHPVEIVDLDRGIAVVPVWDSVRFAPALQLSASQSAAV